MATTRKGVGKLIAMKKVAMKAATQKMADIKKYSGMPGVGKGSGNPVIRSSYQPVVPKKPAVMRIKRGRGAGTR